MSGLVLSHLDYSNGLFINVHESSLKKLQRVQNIAAKIVLKKGRRDSSTWCLKQLHWLPIKLRVQYKVLTLVHKCINDQATENLKELIKPVQPTRPGLRSSCRVHDLKIPFVKHKTFAERAFSVAGAKLWNNLPEELKLITNFNVFKAKLKTLLFNHF